MNPIDYCVIGGDILHISSGTATTSPVNLLSEEITAFNLVNLDDTVPVLFSIDETNYYTLMGAHPRMYLGDVLYVKTTSGIANYSLEYTVKGTYGD